ncbi:rho guanine nucleotide exchange factor 2-like [Pyrgilauda ruficollis]|uniref:rho guanine nucleotide exchange factor 2-like n=1 Tax=Pyrgilauda ruficollis TaxID=221976 RepID=UPI001B86296C|nr:rho guanine nucleotide exchange factor 2-like [Pyrgilauda ruficollis]
MTGKTKGKDKERMKEAKEKDARYTNGHLFTTISVSGMTMCFACNKSITAKEALVCPTCNVTIHNRCKDTLPNCTKVKQKQQKAALLKNSSALQSVSLRNKNAIRERPNSAIYPSESFRQTLLGPRRGRPSLSLSKSVSTTNISGTFNDDSPLGIRRILSQSTDSLNMRNRTLSVESLIDEGPDVILSQLLSDLEADGKEFEADSWSLAVDNSFLQQHRMDVMKRQDVIYELMQTELHHVRTLKIMGALFRRAMLEELQLDPGTVQRIFPCLDELSHIHERFLAQLLERRRESLAQDSNKNFVIDRLGDILVTQVGSAESGGGRVREGPGCSFVRVPATYTFPVLDKPAVISLQNLIVRDIANQEKGMFLISAAPPEMYEVHAASRDDRNHWMKVIQQAVSLCPSRQDFPLIETETEASLRKLKGGGSSLCIPSCASHPLSHASAPAVLPFHPPAFPGARDELEFRATDPERLREGEDTLDVLLEDEGGLGGRHSPPASPRDFLRMQDIPEEVENSQELKEGDGDS